MSEVVGGLPDPTFTGVVLNYCRPSAQHANHRHPCSTAGYLLSLALRASFCLAWKARLYVKTELRQV